MLYLMLDVQGPHEFAELPEDTKQYWSAWFNERARRAEQNDTSLQREIQQFT